MYAISFKIYTENIFKILVHLVQVKGLLNISETDHSTLPSFEEENTLGQTIQQTITDLITYLHGKEDDHRKNILVFLPTYKALEQQWSLLNNKGLDVKVFVLHSSIDMDHSIRAMEVSLPVRKVTSNITSIHFSRSKSKSKWNMGIRKENFVNIK